jgi:hypothetical protein
MALIVYQTAASDGNKFPEINQFFWGAIWIGLSRA